MSSVWSLSPEEVELARSKPAAQRLGFALQLKMHALNGRFFETAREAPVETIEVIAAALGRPITDVLGYDWEGRTGRRHREEILKLGNAKRMAAEDREALSQHLLQIAGARSRPALMDEAQNWCAEQRFRAPAKGELDRLIRSMRREFEAGLLDRVTDALTPDAAQGGRTGFARGAQQKTPNQNYLQYAVQYQYVRLFYLGCRSTLSAWIGGDPRHGRGTRIGDAPTAGNLLRETLLRNKPVMQQGCAC